jgi:hypothetical protein
MSNGAVAMSNEVVAMSNGQLMKGRALTQYMKPRPKLAWVSSGPLRR